LDFQWIANVITLQVRNPHNVTKTQVGLSNVLTDFTSAVAANTANLDLKVDKITGKGLSTEDYTTAEKTKLAVINNIKRC
jgi:hypothetical protein